MSETISTPGFGELALSKPVLKALDDVGYETPTPIQALTIPIVLSGKDLLGQAQTGTGKTAAFALPLLSQIDIKKMQPQVLVLAPTRELAIQVAEAFQRYASRLKGFHVAPIYGGQEYGPQLRQLKRGAHVVVGTPGRVMDHMRRKTLNLKTLRCLVLDEADEMLRMGFIDDVEWILEQTPPERQIALFSATLPKQIRNIAQRHLQEPEQIIIKDKTSTAATINQRYWMVSGVHKLDALTRILEAEPFDGMIVFVRTRIATVELAEKLEARGFNAAPLNGDIAQKKRERTIDKLRNGKLDILVATDVAARGLDVDRISHVFNYDIPHDTESYVHRVGRTGRAGRSGEAILFVAPREKRMLFAIEKATQQKITMMKLPTSESINNQRIENFKQSITDTLAKEGLEFYSEMLEKYRQEHNIPALDIAAALAKMVQGDKPMLLPKDKPPKPERTRREDKPQRQKEAFSGKPPQKGMERFRIEVGAMHGVTPEEIIDAIVYETGLDRRVIREVDIHRDSSTLDLPEGMPRQLLNSLKKTNVSGQQLGMKRLHVPKRTAHSSKRSHHHSKAKSRQRKQRSRR